MARDRAGTEGGERARQGPLVAAAATRLGERLAARDREWLKECISSLNSKGVEGKPSGDRSHGRSGPGIRSEWAKLLKERIYGALRRPKALNGEERLACVLAALAVGGRHPEMDEGLRDQDWPIEGLRPQARSAMIKETAAPAEGRGGRSPVAGLLGPNPPGSLGFGQGAGGRGGTGPPRILAEGRDRGARGFAAAHGANSEPGNPGRAPDRGRAVGQGQVGIGTRDDAATLAAGGIGAG